MTAKGFLAVGTGVLVWGVLLGLLGPWAMRGQLPVAEGASRPWSVIATALLHVLGAGVAAAGAGTATGLFKQPAVVGATRWVARVAAVLAFVGVFAGVLAGHAHFRLGWWWLPFALVWSGAVLVATYGPWVLMARWVAGRAARRYGWLYAAAVLAVVAAPLAYGYVTWRGSQVTLRKHSLASTLRDLRGAHVPPEGRVVRIIEVEPESKVALVPAAPIGFYPGAVVQGVDFQELPGTRDLLFTILLGAEDPAEEVLRWYQALWAELRTERVKGPSLVYRGLAPQIEQESLVADTGPRCPTSVDVQRGPAIQMGDAARYRQWMEGRGTLAVDPNGGTLTEIRLVLPAR